MTSLISPSTIVFVYSLLTFSSVVISFHTLLLSVSLLSELSVKTSLHLSRLFALLLSLYPVSFSLAHILHSSSCILYGAPRDVSAISRSLISDPSSWQRAQHAEEHRHKAQPQLMRPRTPTATITRPLQHLVSSLLRLVRWAVAKPQLNNCS